ncbi:MAG: hypothetical protein IT233_11660 [Bacteroidia bacterium]|nr:hypothetical protein [Bacteroidia bacterium]
MKSFLLRIFFFLLPVIGLMYPVDWFLSNHLSKAHTPPGEIEVWNAIYSGAIDAEVAVYGSSRAWVQIDPHILQDTLQRKVYNFGIDGHKFRIIYLRHLEYLRYNPPPRLIILSLDVFSLEEREDLYGSEQFLPFVAGNDTVRKYISSMQGFSKYDYALPSVRYYGEFRWKNEALRIALGLTDSTPFRKNGFRNREVGWRADLAGGTMTPEGFTVVPSKETIRLFRRFILDCREKNIELLFVYTPELKETRDMVRNRDAMLTLYKNYSRVYGVPFLDYSEHPVSYDRSYFYNNSHLNAAGVAAFTPVLAADIRKYIPK